MAVSICSNLLLSPVNITKQQNALQDCGAFSFTQCISDVMDVDIRYSSPADYSLRIG